jgi:hypothetical protein
MNPVRIAAPSKFWLVMVTIPLEPAILEQKPKKFFAPANKDPLPV